MTRIILISARGDPFPFPQTSASYFPITFSTPPSSTPPHYLYNPLSGSPPGLPIVVPASKAGDFSGKPKSQWFMAALRLFTGWMYVCPSRLASEFLAAKGVKVFEYSYTYANGDADGLAVHGAESRVMWENLYAAV